MDKCKMGINRGIEPEMDLLAKSRKPNPSKNIHSINNNERGSEMKISPKTKFQTSLKLTSWERKHH